MIGDQLTYLEAPFYNSNFSKPNGSASPFGETQLDDTKLRSDGNELSQKRPATLSREQQSRGPWGLL